MFAEKFTFLPMLMFLNMAALPGGAALHIPLSKSGCLWRFAACLKFLPVNNSIYSSACLASSGFCFSKIDLTEFLMINKWQIILQNNNGADQIYSFFISAVFLFYSAQQHRLMCQRTCKAFVISHNFFIRKLFF